MSFADKELLQVKARLAPLAFSASQIHVYPWLNVVDHRCFCFFQNDPVQFTFRNLLNNFFCFFSLPAFGHEDLRGHRL